MSVRPAKHLPSLIRVLIVRMKKPWVLNYPLSAQWRLWLDWVDAQAGRTLILLVLSCCGSYLWLHLQLLLNQLWKRCLNTLVTVNCSFSVLLVDSWPVTTYMYQSKYVLTSQIRKKPGTNKCMCVSMTVVSLVRYTRTNLKNGGICSFM